MRTSRAVPLVAFALVGVAIVAATATYVKSAGADKVPQEQRRQEKPIKSPDVSVERTRPSKPDGIYVPEPVYKGEELTFEKRESTVEAGRDPRVHVIQEYLKRTQIADPASRILSVEVKDGMAMLYFNEAFRHTMGSGDESVLVNGLAACLGQFKDIDEFQLYADGELIESFGHLDLLEPIKVNRL